MMGVGKTTIGKFLANQLNKKFFDIDQMIEKTNKMSIIEIFENRGEDFFRKIEETITLECLEVKDSVISLGGGAFINEKIRKKVLKNSISFWLTLNTVELKKRLKNSRKRPLLNKINLNQIENLVYKRNEFYSQAKYVIKCDELSLKEVSKNIINLYTNVKINS